MRGELSRRLTAIGKGLEAVHQPLKEWEKELGDILILANEYRNDLNHAGMRKEPKPSSNMIKKAHEVKSITGDFLDKYLFVRSEEHTSELQSRGHLVCRLLLEK